MLKNSSIFNHMVETGPSNLLCFNIGFQFIRRNRFYTKPAPAQIASEGT
jgi:hypothetical protein